MSRVGPDVATPDEAEVLAAIEAAPSADDWPAIRELVVPVLPRVRPFPPGYPAPLRTLVPPGIAIGFGVDIGPAFLAVSPEQLRVLAIDELDLVTQSLANLKSRATRVTPAEVIRQEVDGVRIEALQTGRSIGSTLILVPEELRRIFGPEPRLFMAPMRDVLLGYPPDVDPAVPGSLYELIAGQDPNCLPPIGYLFDGHAITLTKLDAEPPLIQRLLA